LLKQKGLKAVVISLLVVLTTTCFSLLFTSAYKTFSKETPQAASTYDFASGAITKDNYDTYTIGNLTALQNFATSVNNGVTFYDEENEKCKTVKLTADIDCNNNSISIGGGYLTASAKQTATGDWEPVIVSNLKYFAGKFDGNNKTVSNFKMGTEWYYHYKSPATSLGDYYYYYRGLFITSEEAVIKNTKFCNFEYVFDSSDEGDTWSGDKAVYVALVCYGSCFIENCIVENVRFDETTADNCKAHCGAFALKKDSGCGITAGIPDVENCLLISCTISSDVETFVFGGSPYECVSMVSSNTCSDGTFYVFTDEEISDYRCYYNKGDKFANLSSISNIGGNSGSIWYYCGDEYKNGWPMLRSFIKFQTVRFPYSTNTVNENFTVDGKNANNISVPSDAIAFTNDQIVSTNVQFGWFDRVISVTFSSCYSFKNWIYKYYDSGQYYLIPTFEIVNRIISFKSCVNTSTTALDGYELIELNKNYNIGCGSYVYFQSISSSSYKVYFTDRDGIKRGVVYTISNSAYYISGNTLENYDGYKNNNGYLDIHEDISNITVVTSLKSYDITFG